jgi:hypothetical protein
MLAAEAPASDQVAFADRCERIRWRLLAQDLGFTKAEAARLAFWRWRARHRDETGQRVVQQAGDWSPLGSQCPDLASGR